MAYRYGNRYQMQLLPQRIEEYVPSDDPVRAYDAFIEALDFRDLGITLDPNKVGNSEYHPHAMLKLLVYGYSYGTRSSRKLERACHHNLSFIWLTSNLKPDHKTIAEFRRKNKEALAQVLKQCAKICIKLNLIEGNTLFLDGTKIRANASIGNTWTREKAQRALKHIDERISDILAQCDAIDEAEQGSLVTMGKELKDQKTLKAKIKGILQELKEEESFNTTDPECTRIKKGKNFYAGFNFQSTVDKKKGLILSVDVVSENNDLNQFASQINKANHTLNKKCEVAVADCGYASTDDLEKIDNQGIKVVVPSQRQVTKGEPSEFAKERFTYKDDYYICPEGHKLTPYRLNKENNKVYKITDKKICLSCPHYGICTTSPTGRTISRLLKEEVRQKLEAQYNEPSSQEIYKLRKEKVELPFGHIKHNLKFDSFLLRGLKGAKAEASIIGTCFNLVRMITLLGVPGLIKELNTC
ncbi:MAG: IS1182 family transposase [Atribacteria sp.]|nr:IS1182 family transposase [Candidatus Atribacteria bacterium]MCG2761863.1 IS1182 family transposase [Candidatus Atribacteria bacterium]